MVTFLTRRQKEILEFVRRFQEAEGVAPTHREICEHFGFSSYGTAYKHLRLLREKGLIERTPHQRRGMVLTPEATGEGDAVAESLHEVPFLGRIAAGQPIEALPGDETLEVPAHLLRANSREHYVLQIDGQSMIDEGVLDGDYVVVRRREQAEPGEMIVALIEGDATLKRYYPEGRRVRLQPANVEMEPIWVDAEQLRIQGVVVGLMRRF
ncbi:MAG TPA: transcriptional repressor LexA [Thermoanaerobaculia bacterium]|nr:transcriptional repressor LexA [Thermoanaerobaculia bacterium]